MKKFSGFFILLYLPRLIFGQIDIQPPMSDKTFPYVSLDTVWEGIPLSQKDVLTSSCAILADSNLSAVTLLKIHTISLALGNWIQDPDYEVASVLRNQYPQLVFMHEESIPDHMKNIIHIQRPSPEKLDRPSIFLKTRKGKKYLIVTGKNEFQIQQAIQYLANVIAFKANAYKTFFAFTELRGMIERGNFAAAKSIIQKADGLSACGRNMVLVQPKVQHFPAKMKKLVKERNRLLYRDLSEALSAKDQKKSRDLWQRAMKTCYACHQGASGFNAVRKFTPPEEPHRFHQKVIKIYSLEKECQTCHYDNTGIRGYEEK